MNKQKGYTALITVIIISAVLMIAVTSIGGTSLMHRLNLADAENFAQSKYMAEACIYRALVNLAYDKNYSGSEALELPSKDTCAIEHIPPPNEGVINIIAHASIDDHYIRISAVIKDTDMSIISWQEIP